MAAADFISAEEFSSAMDKLGAEPASIAVAVSGGGDSLALTLLLQEWSHSKNIPLLALTVDHCLRPDSTHEAEILQGLLTKRGVHHKILTWQGAKPSTHIQEVAREARYRLLTEECKKNNISTLALAHNLEDQIETFWMRLAHGSGLDGLSAMAPVRKTDGITLLRPVLSFTRERLRATCNKFGAAWTDDPSNKNEQFLRVKLRGFEDALASEGLTPQRLNQTVQKLASATDALEFVTNHFSPECLTFYDQGYASLGLRYWRKHPAEIQRRIMAKALHAIAPQPYPVPFEQLDSLREHCLTSPISGKTLAGCEVLQNSTDTLIICRELHAVEGNIKLANGTVWDGRFIVSGAIESEDLEIGALGEEGLAILKKELETHPEIERHLEVMNAKVRRTLPGIWQKSRLVAVPHVRWFSDLKLEKIQVKLKTP